MNNTSIPSLVYCVPDNIPSYGMALLFFVLPVHFLVGKVLAFNLRFENPRHIILICLSASDSIQVTVIALCSVVFKIGEFELTTVSCDVLRYTLIFIGTLTVIVSSLTIVALSIERYIACYHSYRIPELLTNEKIIPTMIAIWICGAIGGGIACIPNWQRRNPTVVSQSAYMDMILTIIGLATSLILMVIQSSLFYLSRKKLTHVQPGPSFSNQDEEENIRKRQIKVASVASLVVLSYVICMLPFAGMSIAAHLTEVSVNALKVGAILILVNTLLNPFIYGFGTVDIREAIIKELKKMKNAILLKLGLRDEFDT